MGYQAFRRERKVGVHLGRRISIIAGCIRLGKELREEWDARWVLLAWNKNTQSLLLIRSREDEWPETYVVGKRGRIQCKGALREFGLERVHGRFPPQSVDWGQVRIKIPRGVTE